MANDPVTLATIGGLTIVALSILAVALLKGWSDWLQIRRLELERLRPDPGAGIPIGTSGARIELADLKERVRKLEAIAAGVDL